MATNPSNRALARRSRRTREAEMAPPTKQLLRSQLRRLRPSSSPQHWLCVASCPVWRAPDSDVLRRTRNLVTPRRSLHGVTRNQAKALRMTTHERGP